MSADQHQDHDERLFFVRIEWDLEGFDLAAFRAEFGKKAGEFRMRPSRIINVHHSFLPAFVGARPCHAAFRRGVKLIGATSHYVTEVLDDGPIIEQDVVRISHRDQVDDLVQKGRDLIAAPWRTAGIDA